MYLKDPKHIQGFGSNVVHVNVSCGQTVPEKANSRLDNKAAAAPLKKEEDDEDAQTFIIQLTEEQTR